jgi:signal transduction histidine kinase
MQTSDISNDFVQKMPEIVGLDRETEDTETTPQASQEQKNGLEAEGIRSFMAGQRHSIYGSMLLIPLLFITMYAEVNMVGLWLWLASSAALAIYRLWLTNTYEKQAALWNTDQHLRFRAQHAWTWPVAGALWGFTVWLFYTQPSLSVQLIVWINLACIGIFGALGFVSHLKTMRHFVNSFMLVCVLGMVWTSFTSTNADSISIALKQIPLVLVFWITLIIHGKRLHEAFVQRLVLRKRNLALIESLKTQTQRAVEAIEIKNRFLASAAHDIRQPVLALDLYASMLKSEPALAAELTPKISLATQAVIEMFDSLFDLSRVESGQLNMQIAWVDADKLIEELAVQFQPIAAAKNLQLRVHKAHHSAGHIKSDPQLLKRILSNLMINAIKFTSEGGVMLVCKSLKNSIRFEVWDTGIGIAADQQKAVFQEFYKAPDQTQTATQEGFGLGLSIVARFCESLGHTFSMRSRVGRGSVFRIDVPNEA